MKIWITVSLALFLSLPLTGCLNGAPPSSDDDLSSRLGLGITIPDTPPPRAPLQDNAADVEALRIFLEQTAPEIAEQCTRPIYNQIKKDYIDRGFLLQAFFWFQIDCMQIPNDYEERIISESMRNGTEQEMFNNLKRYAEVAIRNSTEALSNVSPTNGAEAQIYHILAENVELSMASIATAELYFGPYQEGWAKDELQLSTVYGSLYAPWKMSELQVKIIDEYGWGEGFCEAPPIEELERRIQSKIDYATKLASERDNPENQNSITTRYGRITKDLPVQLEVYVENQWWPALLGLESEINQYVAFYENYTAERVPTQDEARYLLAEFRSHTNTLWTEYLLHDFEVRIEEGFYPWEEDKETGGLWALSVPALNSPFIGLQCTGPEQSSLPLPLPIRV